MSDRDTGYDGPPSCTTLHVQRDCPAEEKKAVADKTDRQKTAGIRLAVYGTLRNSFHNHYLLEGADYLGTHTLPETAGFRMVSLGGFPAVSETTLKGTPIVVEVYRLRDKTQLDACDALEGHPNWYKRSKIHTPWKSAWMYLLPTSLTLSKDPVASGDWVEHVTRP